jgi:hypothetical protein
MKDIMKKIKSYILVAMVGLSVTSCEDFLTLMPLNEVVLENFWTNEKDVESVLLGAYASLETSDCVTRMAAWGEMRSDNIIPGTDNSGDDDLSQFINENFTSKNSLTTYLCFYKAINYANTVLHYAPEVKVKDPNFHGSELAAVEAEAIAIRSLCYWYLIRAFGDVPYVTEPSIDDTKDFFIGQTKFDDILESLISDLENYKKAAQGHFSSNWQKKQISARDQENTSRFTRTAIEALLADMYLWKGDWKNCIDHCKYIDSIKLVVEYPAIKAAQGLDCTIDLINGYPLIAETVGSDVCGNAYNEIFGDGKSFETIFELPFDRNSSNPFVSSYYNGQSSTTGRLKATSRINRGSSDAVFNNNYDIRYYQNILESGSDKGIVKYVYQSVKYNMKDGTAPSSSVGTRRQNNSEPNWIVYRYTDIMLMEAEAYVMWAKQTADADSVNSMLKKAFDLVDAVNKRAICYPRYASTPLDFNSFNTVNDMEELVLAERRRELMFEGKRWFDLVRKALRDGNADYVSQKVAGKNPNGSNSSVITNKLKNLKGLFLPINYDEIKINDKLIQNSAYSTEREQSHKAQ